jgi:hypothetical protein
VRDVLIGTARDLVRIALPAGAVVRGRPDGDGFRIDADIGAAQSVALQLAFREERQAAETLAREAREADKAGEPGRALAAWGRLLDELPFDVALVREADTARGQGVKRGLEEVQRLKVEVERARFFRLPELFRDSQRAIDACAARYAGSEVESAARDVAKDLGGDLEALQKDLDRAEARRLAMILKGLEAQKMPKLATRVRATLSERFGVTDDGAALLGESPNAAPAGSAGGDTPRERN